MYVPTVDVHTVVVVIVVVVVVDGFIVGKSWFSAPLEKYRP